MAIYLFAAPARAVNPASIGFEHTCTDCGARVSVYDVHNLKSGRPS